MICCFPFGAVALTLFYLVFYVLIRTQFPRCLLENDSECGAEGVNNSVWVWLTHLFNASIVGFLSLHLLGFNRLFRSGGSSLSREAATLGGLGLACISLAFITNGAIHIYFGNSGIDDGKGMKIYYALTAVFYMLMGISSTLFAILSHLTMYHSRTKLMVFAILNVATAVFVVSACVVVTISEAENFFVDTVVDLNAQDRSQLPFLFKLVSVGQGFWNASYICFLLSLAFVWGSMAKKNTMFVMGLPNSLAAAGMIVAQLIVAILRLIILVIKNASDRKKLENSAAHRVAPLVFDYAALMTVFFAHNLIFTLFSDEDDVELSEKDDHSQDYPTDKSYYSGDNSIEEESDDEEGFTITLNGDVIDTSNNTNYSHIESSPQDITYRPTKSIKENNAINSPESSCCKYYDNDIESGNDVEEKKRQQSDSLLRSINDNVVNEEETLNKCDASELRKESIYDYVSSFLPYSQKKGDQDSRQKQVLGDEGALLGSKSNDIVSMLVSAVTTSAVADNFAAHKLTWNDSDDTNDVTNGSAGHHYSNVQDNSLQSKLSNPDRHFDSEATSLSLYNNKSIEHLRPMEVLSCGEVACNDIRNNIDNESSTKTNDGNSVECLDERDLQLEKESLDISIESSKKSGITRLKLLEEIELPLEDETLKSASDGILADLHSIDLDDSTRKRSSPALLRSTLIPKKKRKAKRYRKKTLPRKMRHISRAMNEEEERNSTSSSKSGGSRSVLSKRLNDCDANTRIHAFITPELGESRDHKIRNGVKPIYWERKSTKSKNVHQTDDDDNLCQQTIDEFPASKSKTPPADNHPSIEKKLKLPMSCSNSAEQDVKEGDQKLPSLEDVLSVHSKESDQMYIPSSGNGCTQLNCLNESLLALTTVLNGKVGTYCNAPSKFQNFQQTNNATSQIMGECSLFTKSPSLRFKKERTRVPGLLKTTTFSSDCVSTLTSDFDESDFGQPIPVSLNNSIGNEVIGENEVISENDASGRTEQIDRKKTALNCDELEEYSQICRDEQESSPTDKSTTEVKIEGICDRANNSDKIVHNDRHASIPAPKFAQTSYTISEQEKGIEEDNAIVVSPALPCSKSQASTSVSSGDSSR
uniref:Uncharacterized protein n=1 Tax=Pseudo-nitzschia australis TaxID=44445 RepID=A0A7S4A8W3_9STRA